MAEIKNKRLLKTFILALIILALTAFVFANSSQNAEASAKDSGLFVAAAERLLGCLGISVDRGVLELVIRKAAHFTEYFVLGAVASVFAASFKNVSVKKRIGFIALTPLYCLAVALCDEFIIQSAAEGRSPEILDAIIDFSGSIIASVSAAAIIYFKNKKTI